jgi:4a-hydroxytetrahydrobiopterin dehydratase
MIGDWRESRNGLSLEAKYVFDGYSSLRDFLDEVANITEAVNIHPNMSFGRDYASLIIYATGERLSDEEKQLAEKIDKVYQQFK